MVARVGLVRRQCCHFVFRPESIAGSSVSVTPEDSKAARSGVQPSPNEQVPFTNVYKYVCIAYDANISQCVWPLEFAFPKRIRIKPLLGPEAGVGMHIAKA